MTRRGGSSLALALALGLTALAAGGCKKKMAPAPPAPTAVPTPSPDKDAVVFVRSGQLWLMKWDGSSAAPLASRRDASFWFPSASPKGDDVLAWMSRADGTEDVVRVRLDGKVELLTDIGERAAPPMKNMRLGNSACYDSKGERIAYAFNGRIWLMNRDGYQAETLISDGLSYSPVWSPDDKKIAYINGKSGHYDLWVTDVESRDTWQVTDFQAYSVGHPRWVSDGKRLMLTRCQKDDSDLVTVLADTDVPLVDSDVLTSDKVTGGAELNKDGKYLAFTSSRPDPKLPNTGAMALWEIWTSDAAGKEAKRLSTGGGVSPTWIRPTQAAVTLPAPPSTGSGPAAAAAAKPVPAVPSSLPTPAAQTAAAHPTAVPVPPTPAPVAAQPTPIPAAAKPAATQIPTVAAAAKPAAPAQPQPRPTAIAQSPVSAKPAPTQPPVKAPPLRLRLRASFDPESDELQLASLTEIKKTAGRVKQYAGENIQVFGPLDRAALRGRYPSEDDRSKARAEQVASALARESGIPPTSIKALPYVPVIVGAQAVNGIEVHVELK